MSNLKHGMNGTRFYHIWENLIQRCNDKKSHNYQLYGAKGINVCDEWLDFKNFKKDMYQLYSKHVFAHGEKNTTIDRINNSSLYSKDQCRWATQKEQANNRKTNHLITLNGITKNLTQWAESLDMGEATLRKRINNYGWLTEKALTTGKMKNQYG